MTDPTDPTDLDMLDALDALASAHVDGQTTDAEAARIAADPELTDRVARMVAVREAVRAAGAPVDETRREQAVAAALAAFDALDPSGDRVGSVAAGPAAPLRLDDRRRQAQRRLRLVGAAAAIALLALAVPLLSKMGSDDSDDDMAATALDDDSAAREETADDETQGGAGGDAAPSVAGPETFAVADLGSFDDLPALTDSVQALLARGGDGAAPTTTARATQDAATEDAGTGVAGSAGCPSDPERGTLVLFTGASLEGRPVLVSVYEQPTGALELVVVASADCSLVDARPL